jgi:hypothetical protein
MAMEQMPPQGAPAPEGAAPAEGGGDQFTDLVTNISNAMGMLSEAAASINPGAAEKLNGLADQFQSVIVELTSGGAPQAGGGQVSPEVGAGKAIPAGPAGVPRG